ncbi:hypothetical protein KDX09_35365 [Burkholderia cenocepacia]|uniref:hypothetical protein n=1 Tax=Burkholderia cenocepacia TaxID=95486 RepID=UPI001B9AB0FB|nr:hypothetical protein [Burkholderia cenocepacia]MBR8094648.1 hypothetical protein [Burkholderia cenocepacia]
MDQQSSGTQQSDGFPLNALVNTNQGPEAVPTDVDNRRVPERNWAWASGRESFDWMDSYSSVSLDE